MVGTDIRKHANFDQLERRALPNGNTEYRYTRRMGRGTTNPCTSIYEVDPKTYIVVRTEFAGAPNDCVVPIGFPP